MKWYLLVPIYALLDCRVQPWRMLGPFSLKHSFYHEHFQLIYKITLFVVPDLPTPLLPRAKNLASGGTREFICLSFSYQTMNVAFDACFGSQQSLTFLCKTHTMFHARQLHIENIFDKLIVRNNTSLSILICSRAGLIAGVRWNAVFVNNRNETGCKGSKFFAADL